MKAIITGSTSGLGRNMVDFLLEKNWEVIAFGRNEKIGNSLKCSFKSFDLSNLEECIKNFENADIVFHCAALSSPWGNYKDFENANIKATENVIYCSKKYNIKKLVHISSPSIYFEFKDNFNISEDFLPKEFVNHYARTKFIAEQKVIESDINSIILRPRAIFGEYDNVLVPRLEKILDKKGFIPIIKNNIIFSDVTYVGNVTYAMYLSAIKEVPNKSIINITNDDPLPLKMLIEKLMLGIGKQPKFKQISFNLLKYFSIIFEIFSKLGFTKEPLITKYGVGTISFSQTLNISNAKKLLDYTPIYSIEEGISRYAKWKNTAI